MVDCPYNVHYKAYQSLDPCTNIYLKQKWDKVSYEKYVKRVLQTRCLVDDLPPYAHRHRALLKNKENKLKKETNKEIILLNQYDYNLKKAVEDQYKKDLLIKSNEVIELKYKII